MTRLRKARRGEPGQEYTWALLPSADFHQPEAFGVVEHIDERAGDGTYATAVRFSSDVFALADFREEQLLKVTATDVNGASDSCVAPVFVPRGPTAVGLMQGGWGSDQTDGPVTVRTVRTDGVRGQANVLRFAGTGPGPWRAAWLHPGDGVNSAGRNWLTFYVRGDTDQELFIHLVDHHRIGSEGFFDEPHFSPPVALIAGGYLRAVTPTYQKVRIRLDKLLPKGIFFLRWHTAGIGLSVAKGAKRCTYYVGLVQVEP